MTQAPKHNSQWLPVDSLPDPLETAAFVLEPLHEKHAALDFAALMSCRSRLREELKWGNWPPPEFTLEENRVDLGRHYGEFIRGEAFAYTVLSPSRENCLGCIYLERCLEIDGAQLAFWVIDDAMTLESTLVMAALQWCHNDWRINRILVPLRDSNERGLDIVAENGLVAWRSDPSGPLSEHQCFLSTRTV